MPLAPVLIATLTLSIVALVVWVGYRRLWARRLPVLRQLPSSMEVPLDPGGWFRPPRVALSVAGLLARLRPDSMEHHLPRWSAPLVCCACLGSSCGGLAVIDDVGAAGAAPVDPSGTVSCGAAGECSSICCFDLEPIDPVPRCSTSCGSAAYSWACDESSDCEDGECCGTIEQSSCMTTCPSGLSERCLDNLDCGDGRRCVGTIVGPLYAGVCE